MAIRSHQVINYRLVFGKLARELFMVLVAVFLVVTPLKNGQVLSDKSHVSGHRFYYIFINLLLLSGYARSVYFIYLADYMRFVVFT